MIGILTEKPSASRNFAKALGGMTGTYNGEQYAIVSARGHLYELVGPELQVGSGLSAKYKSWDLANLPWNEADFSWKRVKKKDTSTMLKDIKSTLSKCSEVVIATDVDPTGEGELLAWEILDELNIKAKWSRMYFTDEAAKSLQQAFVSRTSIPSMDKDMDYVKALYRSKFDFMTMQFTRIATKCGDGQSVLRQGRLKSAMVVLVGDALRDLAAYKKIPFYQNKFKDNNGVVYSNPEEPSFPHEGQVPKIYTPSKVVVDTKEMRSTAPPKLLDLASLASELSGKGIKSKEVLTVYQKMYEAQIVSYPRTEDKCITPEQFQELLPLVDKIATVVGVDTKLLTHRSPRPTHVKSGGAHGANRPGTNVPASLDSLKSYGACAPMIYQILALNYLATLAEDYQYEFQKGHLEKYPLFTGNASVPKSMGYKSIFNDSDIDDTDGQGLGQNATPFVHEGFPPKPPVPTMKWLLGSKTVTGQLEKRDVGTGATRTSIFTDVTNENTKYPLLIEKKGKLSMSKFGDMSYLLLKGTNIGDLKMTEQLMADMRDIAKSKAEPTMCLRRVQQLVSEDLETMKKNSITMRKELNIMGQTTMNQKEKCEGVWGGNSISFNREWRGHRFTDEECTKLLAGEEITVNGFTSKAGKPYGVVGKLSAQVYNGHPFIGFEQLGFAERNGVPDEWCGRKFTSDEKLMLEDGKTIAIEGCVSRKTGKQFGCSVRYAKNDEGRMAIIPKFN